MWRTFCICDYQLQRDIRIFPFTVNLSNMLQNLRYYLLKFVWSCKRKLLFCSIHKRQKMQQQLRLNNSTICNSLKNSLITTLKIRSEMNGTKDTNTESQVFDQIFRASWKFRDLLYKIHWKICKWMKILKSLYPLLSNLSNFKLFSRNCIQCNAKIGYTFDFKVLLQHTDVLFHVKCTKELHWRELI